MTPLLGESPKNVSHQVISSLKAAWKQESDDWQKRDLSKKRYVYFWADGVYLQARMEAEKNCVLVIIGVTDRGDKELVAIEVGYRESKESWLGVLWDLQARGLKAGPELAVGDGALGFWGALNEIFPKTRHQRCWCHKMVNVLDKLPKSVHSVAKKMIQEIWLSEEKESAVAAFDAFNKRFAVKQPRAVKCLEKDRDQMLTFYDFPAEHWRSLRTTNPIESTFATVRHRTKKSKGCFSHETILTMVFKLCESAQNTWIKFRGFDRLAEVIRGVKFVNGEVEKSAKESDQTVAA